MSWLRRWDKRNADWAKRTSDQWADAPKIDGMPIERPNRLIDAYVRYKLVVWAITLVVFVAGLIARAVAG